MVKTWQVGVVTFLVCSLIFLPIGIICILFLHMRRHNDKNKGDKPPTLNNTYTNHIEDCRNAYKKDWDKLV